MNNRKLVRNLPAVLSAGFLVLSAAGHAQTAPPASLDKKLDSPFAAFRAGIVVSPAPNVDVGLDFTFPRLRIGPAWTSRADLEFSARFDSPSFGSRRDAVIALSLCQVYTPGGVNRGRYFAGGGLGGSFGPRSGLSGKVFAGVNLSPIVSVEAESQFPPNARVRAVLMLRLSAL